MLGTLGGGDDRWGSNDRLRYLGLTDERKSYRREREGGTTAGKGGGNLPEFPRAGSSTT
jgi:hypothetical protein